MVPGHLDQKNKKQTSRHGTPRSKIVFFSLGFGRFGPFTIFILFAGSQSENDQYWKTAQRRNVSKADTRSEIVKGWFLGPQKVKVDSKLSHLGLTRTEKSENSINIAERISIARRTLYALIKTGVHGTSGLNPKFSYKIYQIYVIPRLLYSLEVYL